MALNDIENFVIVIMENRSFDHAVGYLSLPDADPPMKVDGLSDDAAWLAKYANNDKDQNAVQPLALPAQLQTIIDPPHDMGHIDTQINTPTAGGAAAQMGGFIKSYEKSNPANSRLVMGHYKADTVPALDFFARNYAVCDNWFSSLPSGTQPNRMMAMGGESAIADNVSLKLPNQPLVYDWLDDNTISWCSYQWAGFPFFTLMLRWAPYILGSLADPFNLGPFRKYDAFHDQWNGDAPIPKVIFIEPKYTDDPIGRAAANDDHSPTGMAPGEDFLRRIYRTLISNPARWKNTMMIVTYDEHGGFFDHVPPLAIADTAGGQPFRTTGVRVPGFVVSPHVAPGKPFSKKLDHTSILQLLADRFTPGKAYSEAVANRQKHLDPLSGVLVSPAARIVAPEFPESLGASMHVAAASAPVAPSGPLVPKETETAKAFDNIAHELAEKRPDLLATPHGQMIAAYVAVASPASVTPPITAAIRMASAAHPAPIAALKPKAKKRAKAKPKKGAKPRSPKRRK